MNAHRRIEAGEKQDASLFLAPTAQEWKCRRLCFLFVNFLILILQQTDCYYCFFFHNVKIF